MGFFDIASTSAPTAAAPKTAEREHDEIIASDSAETPKTPDESQEASLLIFDPPASEEPSDIVQDTVPDGHESAIMQASETPQTETSDVSDIFWGVLSDVGDDDSMTKNAAESSQESSNADLSAIAGSGFAADMMSAWENDADAMTPDAILDEAIAKLESLRNARTSERDSIMTEVEEINTTIKRLKDEAKKKTDEAKSIASESERIGATISALSTQKSQ